MSNPYEFIPPQATEGQPRRYRRNRGGSRVGIILAVLAVASVVFVFVGTTVNWNPPKDSPAVEQTEEKLRDACAEITDLAKQAECFDSSTTPSGK